MKKINEYLSIHIKKTQAFDFPSEVKSNEDLASYLRSMRFQEILINDNENSYEQICSIIHNKSCKVMVYNKVDSHITWIRWYDPKVKYRKNEDSMFFMNIDKNLFYKEKFPKNFDTSKECPEDTKYDSIEDFKNTINKYFN